MIFLWVALILALIWLDRLHRRNISTTILKNKFRLYQLRDELREDTMRGDIEPKNWVFQYLDSSITKMTTILDELTIWRAITIFLRPDDPRLLRARQHLMRELLKPENQILQKYHAKFTLALFIFFMQRHPVLYVFLKYIFHVAKSLHGWTSRAVDYLTEAPESSTLVEYA